MSTPVQLYIYDLSNGLAGQLSLMLTGRQIDGIWHTSIVVFGKEIFYGQGIIITQPGKSHHGSPLRIVDMGETAIDEDTFNEYLSAMREQYTADKVQFNCNSFTNDCMGFLTGGSIPPYVTSLPSDFLSTSFGQALQPQIDALFTSRPPNAAPARVTPSAATPDPALAASILQSVAAQATMGGRGPSNGVLSMPPAPPVAPAPVPHAPSLPAPDAPLVSPMHITTNPASFHSLLSSHRAVVAFFTSATCAPCRMIEPVFGELAKTKSKPDGGVGFAQIDLSVGLGGALAAEYQVHVTPTFLFFLDGRKTHELKGVNAPELKTQVDLLIYEAFPRQSSSQMGVRIGVADDVLIAHAHMSLSLPAVEAIPLDPILFTQVPNLDTMFTKLAGFIDGVTAWNGAVTQAQVKQTLTRTVLPFLKASTATSPAQQPMATSFDHWPALTSSLTANLQPSELFPLVDIWRIALLNASFSAWNATKKVQEGPLQRFMDKALQAKDVPRSYLLTVLRMLANAFSNQVLAREVILFTREGVTKLLVDALLHDDATVKSAAASLGFNIAAYLQKRRIDKVKARDDSQSAEEDEEWETEIVVAILDAVEHETNSEVTGEARMGRVVGCKLTWDADSAPTGGVSWVVDAAIAVYGAGDVVVRGVGCAGEIEGEAGKGGMWGGWRWEEGRAQVDFGGGGQAVPCHGHGHVVFLFFLDPGSMYGDIYTYPTWHVKGQSFHDHKDKALDLARDEEVAQHELQRGHRLIRRNGRRLRSRHRLVQH
ncbi:putative thioredoxin family protein [Boletus reticuloceps]|uniref:Putative thioredoxin family protein n=1 Tax=Boletus reticuloceps TaxID=495285 RepID=A0A8I2YIE5_9AGAM|nr:putative thioredoxin family protein [Boletus reticuloceps]